MKSLVDIIIFPMISIYNFYKGNKMKLRDLIGSADSNLDMEMIQFQYDRKELAHAEQIMQDIIADYDSGYSSSDKVIGTKVSVLSSVLSELVGYNVSISLAHGSNFYTYIIPTRVQNDVLLGNVEEVINYYDTMESDGSTSDSYGKKQDTIESMVKRSYDTMNKVLNTSGMKIDLNRGKVTGLDKDFNQMVFVDFGYVIDSYKLSARECIAALLHEIGHTFMYFIHLQYTSNNVSMMMDTIKNDYIAKGKDSREVLNLIYSRVSGKSTSEVETKNLSTVVLDLARELLVSETNSGRKDVEFTADVFAARFGYGDDLTTALLKMTGMRGRAKNDSYFWRNTGVFFLVTGVTVVYIFLLVLSILMAGTVALAYLGIYSAAIFTDLYLAFLNSEASTFKGWARDPNTRYGNTDYDNIYDRTNRIRHQMIASIKNLDGVTNEQARRIIGQIDSITKMTEAMKHRRKITTKILILYLKL